MSLQILWIFLLFNPQNNQSAERTGRHRAAQNEKDRKEKFGQVNRALILQEAGSIKQEVLNRRTIYSK